MIDLLSICLSFGRVVLERARISKCTLTFCAPTYAISSFSLLALSFANSSHLYLWLVAPATDLSSSLFLALK